MLTIDSLLTRRRIGAFFCFITGLLSAAEAAAGYPVALPRRTEKALTSEERTVTQLQQAAEKGDARAQYAYGLAYAAGRRVPKSEAIAVEWYRRAAEQGLAVAQCKLGLVYAEGRGIASDQRYVIMSKWNTSLGSAHGENCFYCF